MLVYGSTPTAIWCETKVGKLNFRPAHRPRHARDRTYDWISAGRRREVIRPSKRNELDGGRHTNDRQVRRKTRRLSLRSRLLNLVQSRRETEMFDGVDAVSPKR